jgi:hypothetical protein
MGDRPSRQDLLTPELRALSEGLREARAGGASASTSAFALDEVVEMRRAELRRRRITMDTEIVTNVRIGMP